jgi:hypothetical protein
VTSVQTVLTCSKLVTSQAMNQVSKLSAHIFACPSISLSVCLSPCLSVSLSANLSVSPFFYLFPTLFVHLFVCPSLNLSLCVFLLASLSLCLPISLFFHLSSVRLVVCLFDCPFMHLFFNPYVICLLLCLSICDLSVHLSIYPLYVSPSMYPLVCLSIPPSISSCVCLSGCGIQKGAKTLSITTFSIMTLSITINKIQHSA